MSLSHSQIQADLSPAISKISLGYKPFAVALRLFFAIQYMNIYDLLYIYKRLSSKNIAFIALED
jgi:hypothetical protein